MKTHLISIGDSFYVSGVIHSSGSIEYATVKLWDAETKNIYNFDTVLTVTNHGEMLYKSLKLKHTESVNIQKISDDEISKIELYNILGVLVGTYKSVSELRSTYTGAYVISVTFKNGKILERKIIL
jgi:hypothetical protein